MIDKIKILREIMKKERLDLLIIQGKTTKRYLGTLTGSGCRVLITQEEAYLIVDSRYIEEAEQREKNLTIILWDPQIKNDSYLLWLRQEFQHNINSIGIDADVSVEEYIYLKNCGFNVKSINDELIQIRSKKDVQEIKKLKNVISLTDQIYQKVVSDLKEGMSDYEISARLQYYAISAGAEQMSFDTIIGLGDRSAFPHARPNGKKIKKGEIILIDFGIQLDGFQSDMTRVCCIDEPNDSIRRIYDTVLEANIAGIKAIKNGVIGKDVDEAARKVIEKAGYGEYFIHGLGHGIGMDNSDEYPILNQQSQHVLENGMVMSCEPGIYIPGVGGIRIEDDVYLSDGQGIPLNQTSKELLILEGY